MAVTRGADGSVRRCTAVTEGLACAVVSALRRGGTGGAGATRGPVAGAGATGVGCGAHATGTAVGTAGEAAGEAAEEAAAEAAPVGVADRWTAGVARCPVPAAEGAEAARPGALLPFRTGPGAVPVRCTAAPPPRGAANGTRCTAGAAEPAEPAEPEALAEPADPEAPTAPAEPPPTARNGTTGTDVLRPAAMGPVGPAAPVGPANGSDCTGRSRPETAPAPEVPVRPPPARPALRAPSRTACERVPMNDGFCQVGSRPPNPASATGPPAPSARWIGGSPDQAAATTGRRGASTGVSGTFPLPVSPAPPASGPRSRPRTRSHSPTCQPSAPAEAVALVTRDAISAV
ncbi:hypothetical protein AB0D74_04120 [Streptomyces sp. NPDC048278]|uniref:hypothetical protein n=1 Tax=Streptomyces sp. NPDC048278 TaxID=3155809 RepID=UPI0034488815